MDNMATRMKRTQILLTEDQYRLLRQEAAERKSSIGMLVREAVAKRYAARSREARLAAWRRLSEMNLPVADWEQMEAEIERGMLDE
jgi:uncharacterized protein involved in type VI secretion and phage assembly